MEVVAIQEEVEEEPEHMNVAGYGYDLELCCDLDLRSKVEADMHIVEEGIDIDKVDTDENGEVIQMVLNLELHRVLEQVLEL